MAFAELIDRILRAGRHLLELDIVIVILLLYTKPPEPDGDDKYGQWDGDQKVDPKMT